MDAETKKKVEADAANASNYVAGADGAPSHVTVYKPGNTSASGSPGVGASQTPTSSGTDPNGVPFSVKSANYVSGADGAPEGVNVYKAPSGSSGSSAPKGSSSATNAKNTMAMIAIQQNQAAQDQIKRQADYTVEQGVKELERAQEDAQEQFDTQQKQVDIDEAKALDNQALYAEARGDRGGIGQAQYGQIQATAMNNRRAINTARTKLATDTARQIADLRAQGEFEKANALLQQTQVFLGQLMDIQKWGAEFAMQETQFNAQLEQWRSEFDLKASEITGVYNGQMTQEAKANIAQIGIAEAQAGREVSEEMLSAMWDVYRISPETVNTWVLSAQAAQQNEATLASQKAAAEECEKYVTVGLAPPANLAALAGGLWADNAYIQARIADYKRKNTKSVGSGDGGNKKYTAAQAETALAAAEKGNHSDAIKAILTGYYGLPYADIMAAHGIDYTEVDVKAPWDGKTNIQHVKHGLDNGVFGTRISEAFTGVMNLLVQGKADKVGKWLDDNFSPSELTQAGLEYLLAEAEEYVK